VCRRGQVYPLGGDRLADTDYFWRFLGFKTTLVVRLSMVCGGLVVGYTMIMSTLVV
jgi:hypothetical protein